MKLTPYSKEIGLREAVGKALAYRQNLTAETSPETLSANFEVADRPLHSLSGLKPLPAEFAGPMEEAGDGIFHELKVSNAAKPEDDPRHQVTAAISRQSSKWWQALRALHENAGIEGPEQLRAVSDLAAIRKGRLVLQFNVDRIAWHYLTEWSTAAVVARSEVQAIGNNC